MQESCRPVIRHPVIRGHWLRGNVVCADQTRSAGMPKRRKGKGAPVAKEPDPWDALPGAEKLFPEEEVYDPWDEVGIAVPAIRIPSGEVLARASLKEDLNEYEKAGCDAVGVKGRWKGRRPRKGCKLPGYQSQGVRPADLQALCTCFWKIRADERSRLLMSTYGAGCASKVEYFVRDAQVCFHNFCSKLGASQHMRKLISGQPDMRKNQIGKVWLLAREKGASGAWKCDH